MQNPVQFDTLRYQASFRWRARSRWLAATANRLVVNMRARSWLAPAQVQSGFIALSHENSKIAFLQTAKCGREDYDSGKSDFMAGVGRLPHTGNAFAHDRGQELSDLNSWPRSRQAVSTGYPFSTGGADTGFSDELNFPVINLIFQ
jgi:hypothetical protein